MPSNISALAAGSSRSTLPHDTAQSIRRVTGELGENGGVTNRHDGRSNESLKNRGNIGGDRKGSAAAEGAGGVGSSILGAGSGGGGGGGNGGVGMGGTSTNSGNGEFRENAHEGGAEWSGFAGSVGDGSAGESGEWMEGSMHFGSKIVMRTRVGSYVGVVAASMQFSDQINRGAVEYERLEADPAVSVSVSSSLFSGPLRVHCVGMGVGDPSETFVILSVDQR